MGSATNQSDQLFPLFNQMLALTTYLLEPIHGDTVCALLGWGEQAQLVFLSVYMAQGTQPDRTLT